MRLYGLTGGIATGKSYVGECFKNLVAHLIDADLLAREVVEPGRPAYEKIVAEFGKGILDPEGYIDRKRLGALVFADSEKRKRLESYTHPEIMARRTGILTELEAEGFDGIVIVDAPLLVEAGGAKSVDRLVVVYVEPAAQRDRLMTRDDISEAEAERKIRSQMPLEEKVKLAHYVIGTSESREATAERVRQVHRALLADLRALQVTRQ